MRCAKRFLVGFYAGVTAFSDFIAWEVHFHVVMCKRRTGVVAIVRRPFRELPADDEVIALKVPAELTEG